MFAYLPFLCVVGQLLVFFLYVWKRYRAALCIAAVVEIGVIANLLRRLLCGQHIFAVTSTALNLAIWSVILVIGVREVRGHKTERKSR